MRRFHRSPMARWLRSHSLAKEASVAFELRCGDVLPGCAMTLSAETEASLMAKISDHAKADHPDVALDTATVEQVKKAIRTN